MSMIFRRRKISWIRDKALLAVRITKEDVAFLMSEIPYLPSSEAASRLLRECGGDVEEALRRCVADVSGIRKVKEAQTARIHAYAA